MTGDRASYNECLQPLASVYVLIHVWVLFRKPTWLHPKWSPFPGHTVIQKPDCDQQYARLWIWSGAVDTEQPNMFLSSKADSNLSASGPVTAQQGIGWDSDLDSSWGWRRIGPKIPAQRERERETETERERGQAVGVEKHSHLYWTWLKIRDVAVCNAFEKTVNKCAEVSAVGRWVLRNNFFVPFMTLHVCFKLQGWCFPPWSRGLLFKARCAAPRKPLAVWSFSAASFWLSVGSWSL